MKTWLLSAVAVACAFSASAMAQDARQARPDPFGAATITRTAVQLDAARKFATLDLDKDGALSAEEFQAQRRNGAEAGKPPAAAEPRTGEQRGGAWRGEGRRGGWLARLDTNKDSRITVDEFTASMVQRFDRMDGDHDGQLTKAERDAARAAMMARMEERRAQQAAQGGEGFGGGQD